MKRYQPIGHIQILALHSLVHHKRWPGGWVLGTDSRTRRVLDSLARRGLVVETNGSYHASRRGVCTLVEVGETVTDRGMVMRPDSPAWRSFIIQFPLGDG